MSKGSRRRPPQIGKVEEDLRWELIRRGTTETRKAEIRKILEEYINDPPTIINRKSK